MVASYISMNTHLKLEGISGGSTKGGRWSKDLKKAMTVVKQMLFKCHVAYVSNFISLFYNAGGVYET